MVLGMVVVGGITRLSGSGLSMVDWRPLMGALPPLGEARWNEVFDLYKTSPQYLEVNSWMQLADFKRIFFWEYLHRILGRLTGIVAFLPLVFFVATKKISRRLAWRSFVAVLLGGLQGLVGWYMVKSGLVDRPEVSHLRLAAHLLLAIFISQWVLWILLDLYYPTNVKGAEQEALPRSIRAGAVALLALVALQLLYGAWMAGTRAGMLFPSFPDMNGVYLPAPFFQRGSLWQNLVHNPHAIHWIHRALGWLLLVGGSGLYLWIRRSHATIEPAWASWAFLLVIGLQFVLGAFAAIHQVPLWLGVAHQFGAVLLVCSTTLLVHRTRG